VIRDYGGKEKKNQKQFQTNILQVRRLNEEEEKAISPVRNTFDKLF